jgi:hypothetical protein
VDAWLAEMEDYIHVAKAGQHSAMELAQFYLKGYASTWWRIVRQKEEKNHGYTWEFFKEHVESKFIQNFDYISRCKLHDLVNATNDNLHQYVRAYFELMLEIRHMHELDRVCQFVMGLPTWAKRKLEVNWPASISEAIMKMKGFLNVGRGEKSEFKKDNKFLHKKPHHEGEWNRGKTLQGGKNLNNSKAQGSSPKEILLRRGPLLKRANPRGMLVGSLKEHASTVTKWGITPRITPSPNRGMRALR